MCLAFKLPLLLLLLYTGNIQFHSSSFLTQNNITILDFLIRNFCWKCWILNMTIKLTSKEFVPLHSSLLLIIFINFVSPGANDLHFYDGTTSADIIAGDVFFEIMDPPELRYSYRIRPAKDFGTPFNESLHFHGVRLVPTVPLHSCSQIVNHDDVMGHIALSERGACSFVYKTAQAQQAGARAVIITESVDKWEDNLDHLIEMVDDKMELDINIPAAFLLGRSGATILRTLRRLNKSYALINLPINMTHVTLTKMNQPPWIAW